MKRAILTAILALPLAAFPARALAAPDNSHTLPVTLACTNGMILTTLNGGYLYHGVGTTGNYIIKSISSPSTGVVRDVPGFTQNGLATLTCHYFGPVSHNYYTVVVMQTPVG